MLFKGLGQAIRITAMGDETWLFFVRA